MSKKNLQKAKGHVKEQKEFDEEVIKIDRVTRVVKGGRRLRFRVTVAIGDRKGRVGVGTGKAAEVIQGIQKAVTRAKANLVNVPITDGDTIPHAVNIKYKSAKMLLMPASQGTGVIAGGSLRKILSLAGVKNVLSKNFGSRNALVTAQASMEALKTLRPVRDFQKKKQEAPKPKVEDKSDEKAEKASASKTAPKKEDKEESNKED